MEAWAGRTLWGAVFHLSKVEVWLPISKYTTSQDPAELTKLLRKGQDLACYRCVRDLQWRPRLDEVIPCDGCGLIQVRSKYDLKNQKIWENLSQDPIYSVVCLGHGVKRRWPF